MKAGHTDGCSEYSEGCQCDEVIQLRAEVAALKAVPQVTCLTTAKARCKRCDNLMGDQFYMLSNVPGVWCSDWCRQMRDIPMEMIT